MRWPLLILAFGLWSCASYFERKKCEEINWYEHGKQVALKGQRLDSDDIYVKCKKAEAEISESDSDRGFKEGMSAYCQPETVLTYGKNGEFVNFEFCDPGQWGALKARHAEGVRAHCQIENGFRVGVSGKKYNNICPSNLEKDFLKEFSKGRKKYLKTRVQETEEKIRDQERNIANLHSRRGRLVMELTMLPAPRRVIEKTYDRNGNLIEQIKDEDLYSFRRSNLRSEIDQNDSRLRQAESEKSNLRNSLYDLKRELESFED